MLKKIIWIIVLYLIFTLPVFAETKVTIEVDNSQVSLWDTIFLDLKIETNSWWSLEVISFEWLDEFHQSGTSQSQNYINKNGEISISFTIRYILSSKNIWNFTLWPAIISLWDLEYTSNILEVGVGNWIKPNLQHEDENLQEFHWLRESERNYIYIPIWILFFILVFYFILSEYLKKNINNTKNVINTNSDRIDHVKSFIIKLEELKSKTPFLSKDIFYKDINDIFRKYFVSLWVSDAFHLTYKELEKTKISQELLSLFKECYYFEFSTNWDEEEWKKRLIDNFIKILKK